MELEELKQRAEAEARASANGEALEVVRVKYLGRKGELTALLRSLGERPVEERKELAPKLQEVKRTLETLLDERARSLSVASAAPHRVDVTAPARKVSRGHLHPLTLVDRRVREIFKGLNFSVVDGPEVEGEYYNFDALNIPANHPARDMWDTFWLSQNEAEYRPLNSKHNRLLLRTHTSPVQIHYMETHTPPFQIIVPGRVFRYEATDQSHEINFYQLEGLMVGKEVSLANFKSIIETFFREFFGRKVEFRYRPSYFPFVEPGLEVDIKLKDKWLEVMGAGMVHPRVFESIHYNPRPPAGWQGFAFGVGLDRLAMIKYGIPDVRLFYSGDLRFIKQF